jgi:hypothetical protein
MPTKTKSSKDEKKCTRFCKGTFLQERERVESVWAKEQGKSYVPVDKLADKRFAKILKGAYVNTCKTVYCNKGCSGAKKDFVDSIEKDKPRKQALQKKGAVSACRDLPKEYGYYDKKKV